MDNKTISYIISICISLLFVGLIIFKPIILCVFVVIVLLGILTIGLVWNIAQLVHLTLFGTDF